MKNLFHALLIHAGPITFALMLASLYSFGLRPVGLTAVSRILRVFFGALVGCVMAFNAHAAVEAQMAAKPPAQQQPQNSLDYQVYMDWCQADTKGVNNWQAQLGYCIGYLQGLYWGQVIGSPAAEKPFCLPQNLSKSEMIKALGLYAEAHPTVFATADMGAGTTAQLVSDAFKDYFTCPAP